MLLFSARNSSQNLRILFGFIKSSSKTLAVSEGIRLIESAVLAVPMTTAPAEVNFLTNVEPKAPDAPITSIF